MKLFKAKVIVVYDEPPSETFIVYVRASSIEIAMSNIIDYYNQTSNRTLAPIQILYIQEKKYDTFIEEST